MKSVTVFLAAAIMVFASGCAQSTEARLQAQYARAVAQDILTRFVLVDPNNPSNHIGAYAVVTTSQDDKDVISCTYNPGRASNAKGNGPISSYVRVFNVATRNQRLYYTPVSVDDALGLMEQARVYGEGLGEISRIFGSRKLGYEPFTEDSSGERHFIFTECKAL
ncbi:MAG TPA: hypothetical protein VGG22_14875 [Candidatus Baltobacteraceae bacterium]|jgi:hypothetical protein